MKVVYLSCFAAVVGMLGESAHASRWEEDYGAERWSAHRCQHRLSGKRVSGELYARISAAAKTPVEPLFVVFNTLLEGKAYRRLVRVVRHTPGVALRGLEPFKIYVEAKRIAAIRELLAEEGITGAQTWGADELGI